MDNKELRIELLRKIHDLEVKGSGNLDVFLDCDK